MRVKIHSHFEDKEWEGDVPREALGENVNEGLFRFFNRVDEADADRLAGFGYRLPSLSVGDRVEWDGLIWYCADVGWELVSSTNLEALQTRYDQLSERRSRVARHYDNAPDGSSAKRDATKLLHSIGAAIREVEKDQEDAVEWFERKQEGVRVAALLDPLPVGYEFRLSYRTPHGVPNAYSALYRKNDRGLWDQVPGTCQPPHVINLDAAHLGFAVGEEAIKAALEA